MTSADAPDPNDGVPGNTPRSMDAFEDIPEDTDLTGHANTAMIDEFAQDAEGDPDISSSSSERADDDQRRAETAEGALSPGSTATGAPTSTDDAGALREDPLSPEQPKR